MERSSTVKLLALSLLVGGGHADGDAKGEDQRPPYYKKWRQNPKFVVFGDSGADSGRRLNAPASFDFEGIGPFPWKKLFVSNDTEEMFKAYLPSPGAVSNGQAWPDWLRVPEELNFATSSATLSDSFRSIETCTGYTGEGENFPTATLEEQIDRYFNDIVADTTETLDYTHVILMGSNDISRVLQVFQRYSIGDALAPLGAFGGNAYEDPVPRAKIFQTVNGTVELTFGPMVTEAVTAISAGVIRLLDEGVTGRILIANIGSFKGIPDIALAGLADDLDQVALAMNVAINATVSDHPKLRQLDLFGFFAAIVDEPALFQDLGFCAPKDELGNALPLGTPCLAFDFSVDANADVMGTQAFRAPGCQQDRCALCTSSLSPCPECYLGNPAATVCEDPNTRIFWDSRHLTTAFHQLFGEAVRQCSKDQPNYERPWVRKLCPVL